MNAPDRQTGGRAATATGFALGLSAYALWGVLPIYFKALKAVAAVDIVAHRVIWSLPFLALLLLPRAVWRAVRAAVRRPRTLAMLVVTALLIGGNWLLYTYAVTSGHILAASFGYYLNPLANVLLGRFVLKERLSRLQWTAVAIAAAGISVLAAGALAQIWISLTLCVSFALYGLLRKIVPADALTGLGIETAYLLPQPWPGSAWRASAGFPAGRQHRHGDGAAGRRRVSFRLRRCCCSPRRPSACLIPRSACCSSSRQRCSSSSRVCVRRAVDPRACVRFPRDLGRAGALRHRFGAHAAAAARAGMMLSARPCSISSH